MEGFIILPENNCTVGIKDIPSMLLINQIKAGWNLGNSLDVYRNQPKSNNPSDYETYWGNPVIKKEIIDNVKLAGFNLIRIPVSWSEHIGDASSFLIDVNWIKRVKEVVDYAIDDNTFVIINIHHEDWLVPLKSSYEYVSDKLKKIWIQIALYFKNYDEHLFFQSMNEPRLAGTELEWTDGSEEARSVISRLNIDFVNTVRSTGGNNKLRHLILTGYCSSASENVVKDINVPDDNKILVSVHSYKPYEFSLKFDGTSKWDENNPLDISDIIQIAENLKKYFIDKNIPVIIDEFGAVNKFNTDDRINHIKYFIKTFKKINVPCIWWDNGVYSGNGERFGLIDRSSGEWYFREIAEAIVQSCV